MFTVGSKTRDQCLVVLPGLFGRAGGLWHSRAHNPSHRSQTNAFKACRHKPHLLAHIAFHFELHLGSRLAPLPGLVFRLVLALLIQLRIGSHSCGSLHRLVFARWWFHTYSFRKQKGSPPIFYHAMNRRKRYTTD